MLLTPTYHVFHMYRHHQGAELLESYLEQEGQGEAVVQESISVDRDGIVTVTLCNHSLHEAQNMELLFVQKKPAAVSGYAVAVLIENIQRQPCHDGIPHRVLLVEKSRVRADFHIMPATPLVVFRALQPAGL